MFSKRRGQNQKGKARGAAKISVIVPFYDVEEYLEKCITSIQQQTLEEIEIICVDDCSPDKGKQIVESLMKKDKRIKLLRHVQNLGLGGARNTGIAAATAPYITGVDSDDYIDPNMLNNLWAATDAQTVDVVVAGFKHVNADATVRHVFRPENQSLANDQNQIDIFSAFRMSFWSKLWRRSLFHDNAILFPKHTYYEDLATTPRLLAFANSAKSIACADYNYVFRRDSIVNTFSAKHIIDYFRVFEILKSFLVEQGLNDRYGTQLAQQMGSHLAYYAKTALAHNLAPEQQIEYVRYLLILKIGFLEQERYLRDQSIDELRDLLLSATSLDDICAPP